MGIVGNRTRTVLLEGIDITDLVISLPRTPLVKSDWGGIPSLKSLSIEVLNTEGQIGPIQSTGLLFGKPLKNMKLDVRQFDRVLWSGEVTDVTVDTGSYRSTIEGDSRLQRKLNSSIKYYGEHVTPAEAAKNLLILAGLEIDHNSFARAHDRLNDAPCQVSVSPAVVEWKGTMGDLLKMLASAAVGRYFQTENGAIGFDAWGSTLPPESVELTDDDMLQMPSVEIQSMDPLGGYSVKHLYGVSRFSSGTDEMQSLDFGANSSVQMTDGTAATYTGTTWVDVSNTDYYRVSVPVARQWSSILTMTSGVRLNSAILGINKLGEVIGIDDSDPRWTTVTLDVER